MKVYAISGLGADARVFQFLKLPIEIITIDWLSPKRNESLSEYAARLIPQINIKQEFILLGVSFGGLIALELSKLLKPKATILISSFDDPAILPPPFTDSLVEAIC